jgi:hypothetical protein
MLSAMRAPLMLILAAGGALAGYGYLRIDRSRELASLLGLLPGADVLADNPLLEQPSLTSLSPLRRWTFAISEAEASDLREGCRQLAPSFPRDNASGSPECVASTHHDQSLYRYSLLALRGRTAIVDSLRMSRTDFEDLSSGRQVVRPATPTGSTDMAEPGSRR